MTCCKGNFRVNVFMKENNRLNTQKKKLYVEHNCTKRKTTQTAALLRRYMTCFHYILQSILLGAKSLNFIWNNWDQSRKQTITKLVFFSSKYFQPWPVLISEESSYRNYQMNWNLSFNAVISKGLILSFAPTTKIQKAVQRIRSIHEDNTYEMAA